VRDPGEPRMHTQPINYNNSFIKEQERAIATSMPNIGGVLYQRHPFQRMLETQKRNNEILAQKPQSSIAENPILAPPCYRKSCFTNVLLPAMNVSILHHAIE